MGKNEIVQIYILFKMSCKISYGFDTFVISWNAKSYRYDSLFQTDNIQAI